MPGKAGYGPLESRGVSIAVSVNKCDSAAIELCCIGQIPQSPLPPLCYCAIRMNHFHEHKQRICRSKVYQDHIRKQFGGIYRQTNLPSQMLVAGNDLAGTLAEPKHRGSRQKLWREHFHY